MNYTESKARAALAAKQLREMDKRLAYMQHRHALENVSISNLPYRVCLDEIKAINDNAWINPYYPLTEIPPLYKWQYDTDGNINEDDWMKMILQPNGDISKDGKPVLSFVIPEVQKQGQAEKARPCKLWDMETDHGRQHWLYWFGAFIMPYADKIEQFSIFDMFGDTEHTIEDLKRQQAQYAKIIKACTKTPDLYRHGIVKKADTLDMLQNEYDILADTGIYPELLEQIGALITTLKKQRTTSP